MRIFLILFFVSFCINPSSAQKIRSPHALKNQSSPEFELSTLKKETYNLTEYRQGMRALTFFFATWCPHCRVQLKELQNKQKQLQDNGVKIILIDVGESEKQVKAFFDRLGIKLDVFLDPESKVAQKYGVLGVPTYYVISEEGVVESIANIIPEDLLVAPLKVGIQD